MRGWPLLALALGCASHGIPPAAVVARTSDTYRTAPVQVPPTLPLDANVLYTIAVDRVPARCQVWTRDAETDEYRWSRPEVGYVHAQRLHLAAAALRITDERQFPDNSTRANTCDLNYAEAVTDGFSSTDGNVFLTQQACATALTERQRVAFVPHCTVQLDTDEEDDRITRFVALASSRGTMYVPHFAERLDPDAQGECETIRIAGNPPNADGVITGTVTYATRPKEPETYRISPPDSSGQGITLEGVGMGKSSLGMYGEAIQTFDFLYFSLATCNTNVERERWRKDAY